MNAAHLREGDPHGVRRIEFVTDQPEHLDLRSEDIAKDKAQELLRLFPEIRTEGGRLDFDRLKVTLGEAVDVGKERYGMSWPGRADCFRTIQMDGRSVPRSRRRGQGRNTRCRRAGANPSSSGAPVPLIGLEQARPARAD
jgi:hypothetical protein